MESQPQNPEFRINPEKFHPCLINIIWIFSTFQDSLRRTGWPKPTKVQYDKWRNDRWIGQCIVICIQ